MALLIGEHAIGSLRGFEQLLTRSCVFRIVAVVLQPILHVGQAGHRRDLDALLEAEFLGGHRAVHAVRQPVVALFLGLDDRSGVHPGARAERVGAYHGIVHRNRHTDRIGDEPAVLGQPADVVVMRAQKLEVHEQQVHLGVADPLTDTQRGCVYTIHTRLDRGETVDQPHAAIAMAVPIDLYRTSPYYLVFHKLDESFYTIGRRMTDRVRQTDPRGAARNRGTIQRFECFGTRARRILGYVHDGQALRDGVRDGLFRGLEDAIEGPIFKASEEAVTYAVSHGLPVM